MFDALLLARLSVWAFRLKIWNSFCFSRSSRCDAPTVCSWLCRCRRWRSPRYRWRLVVLLLVVDVINITVHRIGHRDSMINVYTTISKGRAIFEPTPHRFFGSLGMWRFMWRARWSDLAKHLSQTRHLNGLAPVCFR